MELDVWSGDWGLPSIEFKSLQALTLLKISGAEFRLNATNNPFRTSNGLPELHHNEKIFHNFHHILAHLEQKNYCPDLNLNSKELAESFAFRNMVEEKLYPALRYVWWVDSKNYEAVTRPWFAKMLPFPLNFYYPGRYRQENEFAVQSLYQCLDDAELQVEIFKEAEKCLTCLSIRLGNADFFYGNHPSSLDAFVYGCLAPLLKMPFSANALANHVRACSNLVKFVERITLRYFGREFREYEKARLETEKDAPKSDIFTHKLRNQIFAAVFAVTAMLSYAISTGIFSLSVINTDVDAVEDDEEED